MTLSFQWIEAQGGISGLNFLSPIAVYRYDYFTGVYLYHTMMSALCFRRYLILHKNTFIQWENSFAVCPDNIKWKLALVWFISLPSYWCEECFVFHTHLISSFALIVNSVIRDFIYRYSRINKHIEVCAHVCYVNVVSIAVYIQAIFQATEWQSS